MPYHYIQHAIPHSSSYFSLFRESLDDLGRDMQEEDGCDEGDGENDDDIGVTIGGRARQRLIRE